jgi:hypothetical protein
MRIDPDDDDDDDDDDAGNICTGGATPTFIQAYIRAWRENLCPLLLQLSQLWSGVFIFFKANVDLICASFFCSAQASWATAVGTMYFCQRWNLGQLLEDTAL